VINFISETDHDGEVVIYISDVSKNYLKSYFLVDLMSVLSLFISWESNSDFYYFKLVRFLRIKRFFKFFKFLENFINSFYSRSVNRVKIKKYVELFKIFFFYYLVFHIHACLWYYIGITTY